MRTTIALGVAAALVLAPLTAGADFSGCVLGPSDLNHCSVGGAPAALLAAIAAPVLVAGAAATVAHELRRRTDERAPTGAARRPARTPPSLTLLPEPPDPYRATTGGAETTHAPGAAFRFNETATNVALAAGGVAVLGAMIATVAKSAKK